MPPLERLVFFGTPEFALPTLARLVETGRVPRLVVSRPPRPAGRGQALAEPPVARWARAHGLTVSQPERVRDAAFLEALGALAPDVAVVVAFGQIFPPSLLELPRQGCINLHASLLPRHRGAAPVQAAIAAGDATTGVTTMRMAAGLDSGPILLQRETPIGAAETAGELLARLATLGAGLVLDTLAGLERGTLVGRAQDETRATYAPRLDKAVARVGWSQDAAALANRLRAFTPWPGLEAELRGAPVKLRRATAAAGTQGAAPGTVLGLRDGALQVACGGGSALAIAELQRPGRKALTAAEFANGERLRPGDRFG